MRCFFSSFYFFLKPPHISPPPFLWVGNALLDDDKVFHLVRPADELDEIKSKRGSIKDKSMTKAITEIYLTRLLSVKVKRKENAELFTQCHIFKKQFSNLTHGNLCFSGNVLLLGVFFALPSRIWILQKIVKSLLEKA